MTGRRIWPFGWMLGRYNGLQGLTDRATVLSLLALSYPK